MRSCSLAMIALGLFGCMGAAESPQVSMSAQRQSSRAVRMTMTATGPIYERPVCPEEPGRNRCFSWVRTDAEGNDLVSPTFAASGLSASDLQKLYLSGVDLDKDPGVTLAIVDGYGYKAAESELATYRKQMGLPECTTANGCLKIVNQKGEPSPLPKESGNWPLEQALDLQMASATCPKCKLLLVQGDDSGSLSLYGAQATAAMLGATVISNSFGAAEPDEIDDNENFFNLPSKPSIFAATGDNGFNGTAGFYPSTSAFVFGVGGTMVSGGESAWTHAGSSCSKGVAKRAFEPDHASCSKRASADISAAADGTSGIAVYYGGRWQGVNGTSAATPIVAGIFAVTGHAGEQPSFVYKHPEAFADVTSGSNGSCGNELCDAAKGWDGPTGLGTPIGSKLAAIPSEKPQPMPDMGSPADMSGMPDSGAPNDMSSEHSDMARVDAGTGGDGNKPPSNPPPQGGCSVVVGGDLGGVWLLVAFGLVLALRRRYRRS